MRGRLCENQTERWQDDMKQSNRRFGSAQPSGLYLIELRSRLGRLHRPLRKYLFPTPAPISVPEQLQPAPIAVAAGLSAVVTETELGQTAPDGESRSA